MSESRISFRCLEVIQPIGTFYVACIDAADLVAISFADIRRMEERDLEKYLGIQRTLSQPRVMELAKYVNTIDATFPTAVILAVKSEDAEYNDKLGVMSLTRHDAVAKIIDGQHRIAGLKHYRGGSFLLNVAIFVDMEIEDQASVFATINLSQTKVSKSLAYDLLEYASHRSPQKTAHNVVRVLNREEGSPFQYRIKVLGRATPGRAKETLTQAAFVESLLPYLTNDPIGDRDAIIRGKNLARGSTATDETRFLRNWFLDERDDDITVLLWNYFSAVRRRWPYAWDEKEQGNILNRTTGFGALMRFLPVAVSALSNGADVVPIEQFETLFAAIKLNDADFTPENFAPGGSGASKLLKQLVSESEAARMAARASAGSTK
jgi:DGQHR domain-containing protein